MFSKLIYDFGFYEYTDNLDLRNFFLILTMKLFRQYNFIN